MATNCSQNTMSFRSMRKREIHYGAPVENRSNPTNPFRKHVRVATHTRRNVRACPKHDLPRSEHPEAPRVLRCTKCSRAMTSTRVSGDFYA